MSKTPWFESFFGEDYFEIYRDVFPTARTDTDVAGVVSLLELKPGVRILDLACGHGRHAIRLAQRGFAVTGYDLSEMFLARARADAAALNVTPNWIRGDMRELRFEAEFEAVINLFTAFGYFEDPEDDLRTLRGIRAALAPGGRFLLETLHRDGLQGRFRPRIEEETSNGTVVQHDYEWDLSRDVIDDRITVIRTDGTRREYSTSIRMRSLHSLIALVRRAELEPLAWYGGLDGSTLDLGSHRLALVCERQGPTSGG